MAPSKIEQKKFSKEILNLQKTEELTLPAAIVRYAEIKGVDVINVIKYINSSLKTKLASEARNLNLLKTRRRK